MLKVLRTSDFMFNGKSMLDYNNLFSSYKYEKPQNDI